MSNPEVSALSNQAEKILDASTATDSDRVWSALKVAAVLAELAKAHAIVELADAIRESTFGRNV